MQLLVALLIPKRHPEELEPTKRRRLIMAESLLVTKSV